MRKIIWPLIAVGVAAFLLLQPEPPPSTPVDNPTLPTARPTALAILVDGFAVGDQGGGITVRETDGGVRHTWVAHGGAIRRLVAQSGALISTGDGTVAGWSADTERLWRHRLPEHALNDVVLVGDAIIVAADRGSVARIDPAGKWHRRGVHARATFALAASPDGVEVVSAGADGSIIRWSAVDGEQRAQWAGADGYITDLAWTGRGIYTTDNAGRVRLFDRDGAAKATIAVSDHPLIALAVRGDVAIVGDQRGVAWRVDLAGQSAARLDHSPATPIPLSAVAIDARMLWAATPTGDIISWDVTTGQRVATLRPTQDGRQP